MIQRKQTIFLLLAIVALVACLCLSIGAFEPKTMGAVREWFNLGLQTDSGFELHIIPFVDLVIGVVLSLANIFLYKRRKIQARLCTVAIIVCVLWYLYFGGYIIGSGTAGSHFIFRFGSCLPLVAIILLVMARRGIIADERLVKSIDRIR